MPALEILAVVGLFIGTSAADRAIYRDYVHLPAWLVNDNAETARQILMSIAGAVITVVGIVFRSRSWR